MKVSISTQGMQPRIVSTLKRQNGMRATPAGSEMNVRMIGSIREKKTVASPCFSNQRSAHSMWDFLMRILLAVLLEDVHASGAANPVGEPRTHEVRRRTHGRGGDQAVLAARHVEAGEEHRGLARHGDAGALEQHEDEDARKAHRIHHVHSHLHDRIRDGGDEAWGEVG